MATRQIIPSKTRDSFEQGIKTYPEFELTKHAKAVPGMDFFKDGGHW